MSETLSGLLRSPGPIARANDPHEVRFAPPRILARSGLTWEKVRLWAKRLSWQTLGGWVKYPPGLGG